MKYWMLSLKVTERLHNTSPFLLGIRSFTGIHDSLCSWRKRIPRITNQWHFSNQRFRHLFLLGTHYSVSRFLRFLMGWHFYRCHCYPADALLHVSCLCQLLWSLLRFPSPFRKSRPVASLSHLSFIAGNCTNPFGKTNNEKSNRIPVRLSDKLSLYLRQTIKSKRYGKV